MKSKQSFSGHFRKTNNFSGLFKFKISQTLAQMLLNVEAESIEGTLET
ncbi:MAG: hypothetical protein ACR2N3_10230 [Pyrinomonadaceae bacterium]